MTNDPTAGSYSRFAVVLHWTVAALMLANLAVGWIGEELEPGAAKFALFQWHMSLGLLVLLFSAVRLAWRWF
jgi:cytochrome b561